MFLELWMIVALVVATGLWAEFRYRTGVREGIETTIGVLHEKKMIKIDSHGQLVRHPNA